jgi:Ca2+/Na+ antiporter
MLFAMAISFSLHRQEGHEFIVGNKIRNLFIGLTFLFIGGAILIVYTPPEWLQMTSQALAVLFWVFVAVSYFRKKGQKNTVPTPMDPNLPDKTIAKVISWVVIGFYVAGTLFFVYSPQEGPIKILEIAWDITNVLLAFALIPALLGALLAELLFQQKRHISKNN